MPNKKQSRKNTTQVAKPKAETTTNQDDDWGSILVKTQPNSRASTRSNKSKKSEPEPEPEPELKPQIPEWELVGMSEEEYKAMRERVLKQMREWELENYRAALEADLDSPSYWESRIETLERCRERYNKKRGWSAEDIAAVEDIDAQIQECEENLARIEEEWGDEVEVEAY